MQFPTSPEFSKVEASLVHKNKTTETAGGRDQSYPDGPAKLKIETSFNKAANPDELREVNGFINRMRGSLTPFTLRVPHVSDGEGASGVAPLVAEAKATGFKVKLKGLPVSTLIRKTGDLIQHEASGSVYMLASNLISDVFGFAEADICTPLLTPVAINDSIKIDSILIKVKLVKNEHKYSYESLDIRSIASLTFIQVL